MYWRQTEASILMVEVDGYIWLYNLVMRRFYPVAVVWERDYDEVVYVLKSQSAE